MFKFNRFNPPAQLVEEVAKKLTLSSSFTFFFAQNYRATYLNVTITNIEGAF